jgi:hypothetical protein
MSHHTVYSTCTGRSVAGEHCFVHRGMHVPPLKIIIICNACSTCAWQVTAPQKKRKDWDITGSDLLSLVDRPHLHAPTQMIRYNGNSPIGPSTKRLLNSNVLLRRLQPEFTRLMLFRHYYLRIMLDQGSGQDYDSPIIHWRRHRSHDIRQTFGQDPSQPRIERVA